MEHGSESMFALGGIDNDACAASHTSASYTSAQRPVRIHIVASPVPQCRCLKKSSRNLFQPPPCRSAPIAPESPKGNPLHRTWGPTATTSHTCIRGVRKSA
ncbi:unnamed protein product [Periconia digitata]|uniref:Uncharacterized protein n=1 Tax=Periconia digitata TaxID=1303443 RepID=A0A9W4UBF1_9PLEO|nr:unnamed protein product [Periconia digitata]